MSKKQLNIGIAVLFVVLLVFLLRDTFSQPTVNDLSGGFKEVASYRNQNNTGPVQRIYSVSVSDPTNAQLEEYGNLMPHTKYGNTKVYFFKEGDRIPTQLFPGGDNFNKAFEKNCIAVYEKSAMGNHGLLLNPFTQTQRTQ